MSDINLPAVLVANGLGVWLMAVVLRAERYNAYDTPFGHTTFLAMCRLNFILCLLNLRFDLFFSLDAANTYSRRTPVVFLYLVTYLYLMYGALLPLFLQTPESPNPLLPRGHFSAAGFRRQHPAILILFHFFLTYIRATAFIGYRKRKLQWGQIKREKQQMHS